MFYDTSCPDNYTLLKPDIIIMCFDISERSSIESLTKRWKWEVETHFNYDEQLPVIVLGLKRDLRREWNKEEREKMRGATIMPQEAVRIAQEMRCDLYAECSAATGELFREVVEDIAKTANKRLNGETGRTEGTNCSLM